MDEAQAAADVKIRRNERVKLSATTLNTIGLAFLISGAVVPVITLFYGGEGPKSGHATWIGLWWVVAATILHLGARGMLGVLKG